MTVLRDVLLLAGHTARSQAYIQTLAAHALLPAHALLLGEAPPLAASEPASPERAVLLEREFDDAEIEISEYLSCSDTRMHRPRAREMSLKQAPY